MTPDLLLSIDQGTTNTKASLIGADGLVVFRSSRTLALKLPRAGYVEQSPEEIWQTVCEVIRECLGQAGILGRSIAGIAISNQRETGLAWKRPKRGSLPQAIAPAVSWQCRRSADVCSELAACHDQIRAITGLPVDPLVTAGKWSWMLRHLPEVRRAAEDGSLCLGNVDAWLLACLTGEESHSTDLSNASRTALLDLQTLAWSDALCTMFGIPNGALPTLHASASEFGRCSTLRELDGVPIVAMIGDSHAAMVGHGSYEPGSAKATYGTGSSLMALAGSDLPPETATLARTIAWALEGKPQFAIEGNIAMTGSALQWVGEFLGFKNPVEEALSLSGTVADAAGLVFVPAMVGLGAPYWDASARGTITGLERSHRSAHLARAAIESIAHQIADVFQAMESATASPLPALRTDGGPTRNGILMQLQADLLGREVLRSPNEELSTLGAAALGGLTLGWWSSLEEFATRLPPPTSFRPSLSETDRETARSRWSDAVGRTLTKCAGRAA